jgi:hypothetical protein
LIRRGHAGVAMELLRVPLNRLGVRALFAEAKALKDSGQAPSPI